MTREGRSRQELLIEQQEARARLAAAGVDYAIVRTWAAKSGRWRHYEVSDLNPDAVDAWFAEHEQQLARGRREVGPAEARQEVLAEPEEPAAAALAADPVPPVEPAPSRFDVLLEDPEFLACLAEHCEVYGPQAPPAYARALGDIGAGVKRLLQLHALELERSA